MARSTPLCLLALPLSVFALGCSGPAGFPEVPLASLGSETREMRRGCSTDRCLFVYVAPWCGVCRGSTGMLKDLAAWLKGRGVETVTVVGRDSAADCSAYAREFGPGTLLDPSGRVRLAGGIPQFIVTDRAGSVVRRSSGMRLTLQAPVPEPFLIWEAARFGLVDESSPEAREAEALVSAALAGSGLR